MRLPSAISQVVPSPLHTLSLCVTPPLLPTAHQTSFFLCSGSLGPKASNVLCFWFRLMLYPGSTFPCSPRPCAVWPGVALGPLLALKVGVAIRRGPCLTLTVQQRWDAGCFCRRSLTQTVQICQNHSLLGLKDLRHVLKPRLLHLPMGKGPEAYRREQTYPSLHLLYGQV